MFVGMHAPSLPATFLTEPQYKEQFALFLHQGFTPFIAALKIWPTESGFAYATSEKWKDDAYVQQHIAKLKADEDEHSRAPTKEEFLRDLRDKMGGMNDDELYVKAARVYAEIAGFIEKPQPTTVNVQQNNTIDRVMVVKDHGTAAEWEAKLQRQQMKLVGNG